MKEKEIRYYVTENGKKPFLEWFSAIKDPVTKTRIKRRLERMKEGLYGDYKGIGGRLYELRLDFGAGYRIYFTEHGNEIVLLLSGGDKSTQNKDIEIAKSYLEELKRESG